MFGQRAGRFDVRPGEKTMPAIIGRVAKHHYVGNAQGFELLMPGADQGRADALALVFRGNTQGRQQCRGRAS
jgi:hypothetical protein